MVTDLEGGVNVPCGSIALTCLPVFFLILGSLRSDPIFKRSPSRQDIPCCVHLVGMVNLVQECPCGRGEWFWNYAVSFLLAANNFPFWKAREKTSAMSLSSPDMLIGVRCKSFAAWIHMPRKLRRRPAAREEPDLIFISHPNVEVLS